MSRYFCLLSVDKPRSRSHQSRDKQGFFVESLLWQSNSEKKITR